jgi:hypothetical protein
VRCHLYLFRSLLILPCSFITIANANHKVLRDILQRGEAIARTRHATQSLAGAMGSLFKKLSSTTSASSARKGLRHPRDADCVVVLVLGGVTPQELREAQDIVGKAMGGKEKGEKEGSVWVGGTGLVTPNDVYERIFCKGRRPT